MSRHAFTLTPFPGGPPLPLRISATISRQGTRLSLTYTLTGEVAGVAWPAPAATPQRQDQLWQHTCCECFLARPEESGYWEANLSPAGHWQLYHFDGYRAGMRPEAAPAPPVIVATFGPDTLSLAATLDLAPLLAPDQPLLLGVTMVVRTASGSISYWALTHPAAQPDFHHRAGWTLAL